MHAKLCAFKEREMWAGRQGVVSSWGTPSTSEQSWASLSNVIYLAIKVRDRASFYWLFQESTVKPPFYFFPYPQTSFGLASRLGEWVFLKAIRKNSSSPSKSVLLWANSPYSLSFPCFFLPLAGAAILLNVQCPSFPQSLTQICTLLLDNPLPVLTQQPLFFWSPY